MMNEEKLQFLQAFVLNTKEAKELFRYYQSVIMSRTHNTADISAYGVLPDPNGLNSIRDMAVLEFIQNYLLDFTTTPDIEKGENDDE